MAAVLDPEEVLSPRSEKDNFHRLTRLLISGGTQLLREIFDSRCPPRVLPGILNNPVTKNQLKAAKLTKPQRDCLYPSPGTCGKSEDFDVTLLFRLLRTICSLTPPTTGWDALPASTDHSLEADLARIKHYRNSVYGHVNQNMKITDDDFPQLWEEISQALVRIAGQISPIKKREWQKAIDNFMKDSLTAEDERNVQELQKWYKEDMDVKESIEKLEDTTQKGIESLNKSIEELKECMNEFRVCRRISCPNCNEVDVALLRLNVNCVAIAQPDQREETPGMTGNGNRPPPTTQDVLNLVSQKYLQKIDPSTPEEFNGFLEYLRIARQLLFVDDKPGSLIITVGCRSLQTLDDLWKDYCTGRLNEMAQKYLVTKELLNELGLTEAKLTTSISEEEYRSCQNQLSVYAGLQQKIKQAEKHRDALQNQFFNWVRSRIRTRALQTEFIANPRGLRQKIKQAEKHRDALQNQFFNVRSRIDTRALQTVFTANPRGTSRGRIFGVAALVVGIVVTIFGMLAVAYGEASVTGAIRAAVATGAAGAAVHGGVFAAAEGPRVTFIALLGAAAAAAAAFGWKAALVRAAIALSFIFGMSVVYGNASATGAEEVVPIFAAGAALLYGGVFVALEGPRVTFIALTGAAAAAAAAAAATAAAAFGWKAALVGAEIIIIFTIGIMMSMVYGNAFATGAVEGVATGVVVGAVWGALGVVVNVRLARITIVLREAVRVQTELREAARVQTELHKAARVEIELHERFLQDKMVLLRLMSNVDPLKHRVAELAVYCREHTDQVLSSRLMAREFPYLRDILLKQEAEVRVIQSTLPEILEKELNVHFKRLPKLLATHVDILLARHGRRAKRMSAWEATKLPERRGNGEDSEKISTQILFRELNEGPNDEEIRAMIVDFIEKEFTFFCSDQPAGSK